MAPISSAGGGFASAIKTGRWPELEPATLDHIASLHEAWSRQLTHAAETSDTQYRQEFSELLKGQTGDALQTSLGKNVHGWLNDAAAHQNAATAVHHAADYLRGLQSDLTAIINAGEPEYDNAVNHHDPAAATAILAKAEGEVNAAVTHAVGRIHSALNGAFGTAPASTTNGGAQPGPQTPAALTSYETQNAAGNPSTGQQNRSEIGRSNSHPGAGGANSGSAQANPNGISPSATSIGGQGEPAVANGAFGHQDLGQGQIPPVTQSPAVVSAMPVASGGSTPVSSAPVGGGASAPVSSSGAGQGSMSASPTPATSSAPASTGPSSAAATSSSGGDGPGASPGTAVAPSGSGSGSSVASGIGTSGALPSAMVPPQLSAAPAQSAAAAFAPPPGIADPASTGTASNLSSAPTMGAVSGSDGGAGAVSAGAAGGGTMPTPSAAGPLAPYSPPGVGPLSSTAPPSIPAAPLGSAPSGPAAGGVAPLIAGGGAADRSAGTPTKRVNADLVLAQTVLGGLAKACPARPISWAVSVLRTPVGPQTLIAGSVGGGAYLPPEISMPSTVGLAVLDPALPIGWAAAWMGWQSPLDIVVDHYERLTKDVVGVTVSAMTTSELWPTRPDCGGDFLAVRHEELVMSSAAPLVGGHRLTAADPALAARLTALDRGGDVTNFVAAQLTRAVWTAAAQPDDTGLPVAVQEDADILGLVAGGAARREHWDSYRRDVERRADGAVVMPEIHAPRDADDSPGSVTARMWYRHYYARGRIAEMVACWASQPVSLLDIAYCGVAAGFSAQIAAVVTELEMRLPELTGVAGGTR
jgi:hypothetical protein